MHGLGFCRTAYAFLDDIAEPDVYVVTLLKQKKPAIEITPVPPTDNGFFRRGAGRGQGDRRGLVSGQPERDLG